MKILRLVVLAVVGLFFLLPILYGSAPLPENLSPSEIGDFLAGYLRYWLAALRRLF
ncbi:MAG: hypothetical protein ACXQT6_01640 [Candidatus Methanospirareceae archaeon]|nr:hypothetical protein [Methanophagales archaeon]